MLRFLLIVFLFFQNQNNIIRWNKDRKLSWEDFKGTTKNWSAAAVTYCGIDIKPIKTSIWTGKMTVKVIAYFNTDSSLYFKERVDSNVLRHEQFHFNIAELYARKMRQELSQKKLVTMKTVQEVFKRLYQEYIDFQNRYERITGLGAYLTGQMRMENEISSELNELNSFDESDSIP